MLMEDEKLVGSFKSKIKIQLPGLLSLWGRIRGWGLSLAVSGK